MPAPPFIVLHQEHVVGEHLAEGEGLVRRRLLRLVVRVMAISVTAFSWMLVGP